MPKVLLVEDDCSLGAELQEWLEEMDGLTVEVVNTGEDALQLLTSFGFDLVILDWGLPGLSGMEVLRQFRKGGGETPILFLTARNSIDDKESGLDSGADDYLPKPFEIRELSARCRALLRRARQSTVLENTQRGISLVPQTHTLHWGEKQLRLTRMECAVLAHLMKNPGKQFSSSDLLREVWPSHKESSQEAVRVLIRTLRGKLESFPEVSGLIQTIPGGGYVYYP
ncbi:MAG TPA: response regulator transcription factor [Candidatus Obscuribacterales bacterium]